MRRLTAPVAAERPTLLLELPSMNPPRTAESREVQPKQKIAELPALRSERFQSASLIFSQIVRSPDDFKAELSPRTMNGRISCGLNVSPGSVRCGNPTHGASRTSCHCAFGIMPVARQTA